MFVDNRRVKILTLGAMGFSLFMVMLDNTVINVWPASPRPWVCSSWRAPSGE